MQVPFIEDLTVGLYEGFIIDSASLSSLAEGWTDEWWASLSVLCKMK